MQIYGNSVQTEYGRREVKKMRLIDADLLERKLFSLAEKYVRKRPRLALALTTAINIIRCIDTVDAVPVKHGEWIDVCCEIKCSCCGETYSDEIFLMRGEINYCPNCGAKMAGGWK